MDEASIRVSYKLSNTRVESSNHFYVFSDSYGAMNLYGKSVLMFI